jgi:hypothetical protein
MMRLLFTIGFPLIFFYWATAYLAASRDREYKSPKGYPPHKLMFSGGGDGLRFMHWLFTAKNSSGDNVFVLSLWLARLAFVTFGAIFFASVITGLLAHKS